jgi:hypothetical protein
MNFRRDNVAQRLRQEINSGKLKEQDEHFKKQYSTTLVLAHKAGHVPQFYPRWVSEARAEKLAVKEPADNNNDGKAE